MNIKSPFLSRLTFLFLCFNKDHVIIFNLSKRVCLVNLFWWSVQVRKRENLFLFNEKKFFLKNDGLKRCYLFIWSKIMNIFSIKLRDYDSFVLSVDFNFQNSLFNFYIMFVSHARREFWKRKLGKLNFLNFINLFYWTLSAITSKNRLNI